jgi:hypothetical protein
MIRHLGDDASDRIATKDPDLRSLESREDQRVVRRHHNVAAFSAANEAV